MSSQLQKAVEALVSTEPGWKAFDRAPAKGVKPGGVTAGYPSSSRGSGSGFDESDYDQRQYWASTTLTSSDGIFTFEIEPIKEVQLVGGGKATFKEPTA